MTMPAREEVRSGAADDTAHALAPVRLGDLTVRNRIVSAAHVTALCNGGVISDRFIAYHAARARGGAGLICLEAGSVHPSSPGYINMWAPEMPDGYRRLSDTLHAHGAVVFQQIWHGGFTKLPLDGMPPFSASALPGPTNGVVARAMTKADIGMVVGAFAAMAKLAKDSGIDGVEIHGAHTYLLQQFLSPLTNLREDDYGGSLDNRLRLTIEVVAAVRAAVGPGFPVGIRLSPELLDGGLTAQDNNEIARRLQATGLIDFFHFSLGGYYAFERLIGGMHEPEGYELPTSRVMGEGLATPRVVTGAFRSVAAAGRVIAAGEAELVSLTRALIADPDLPRKTIAGRGREVRPCIGCNQLCIGGIYGGRGYIGCTVNASAGAELAAGDDVPSPRPPARKVVVVGGGPAGMEAARLSAECGHAVVLFESRPQLGGSLNEARLAPTRGRLGDIADWQARAIEGLGVDIRLGATASADAIRAERPDHVIVATGAKPRRDGRQRARPAMVLPGHDLPHVMSPAELFRRAVAAHGDALVYDDVGHFEAVAAAERLVAAGCSVTFVTSHNAFAPLLEPALMAVPALKRLRAGRFRLLTRSFLLEITEKACTVAGIDGGAPEEIPAGLVVFTGHGRPDDTLAAALEGEFPVTLVGDALSPRFLERAIHEGNSAGRAIM